MAIDGATNDRFTLTQDQVGKVITVDVSYRIAMTKKRWSQAYQLIQL